MLQTALARRREFLVTGTVIILSLLFFALFDQNNRLNPMFQSMFLGVAVFLFVPMLFMKIVLHRPVVDLGWRSGKFGEGMLWGVLSIAFALAVLSLVDLFTPFRTGYQPDPVIERSFAWFILYEGVLVAALVFFYETFFRGLVQRVWLASWGAYAILGQAAVFVSLFILQNGFSWKDVPLFLFSPFAGFVAYRSGSLWYSFFASWVFLFLADALLFVPR